MNMQVDECRRQLRTDEDELGPLSPTNQRVSICHSPSPRRMSDSLILLSPTGEKLGMIRRASGLSLPSLHEQSTPCLFSKSQQEELPESQSDDESLVVKNHDSAGSIHESLHEAAYFFCIDNLFSQLAAEEVPSAKKRKEPSSRLLLDRSTASSNDTVTSPRSCMASDTSVEGAYAAALAEMDGIANATASAVNSSRKGRPESWYDIEL